MKKSTKRKLLLLLQSPEDSSLHSKITTNSHSLASFQGSLYLYWGYSNKKDSHIWKAEKYNLTIKLASNIYPPKLDEYFKTIFNGE